MVSQIQVIQNTFDAYDTQAAKNQWITMAVTQLAATPHLNRITPLDYWGRDATLPPHGAAERYRYFEAMERLYNKDYTDLTFPGEPYSFTYPMFWIITDALTDFVSLHEVSVVSPDPARDALLVSDYLPLHVTKLGYAGNAGTLAQWVNGGPYLWSIDPQWDFPDLAGQAIVIPDRRDPDNEFVDVIRIGNTIRYERFELIAGTLGRPIDSMPVAEGVPYPIYFRQPLTNHTNSGWAPSPYSGMIPVVRQFFNRLSLWNDTKDIYQRPVTVVRKGSIGSAGYSPGASDYDRAVRETSRQKELDTLFDKPVREMNVGEGNLEIRGWDAQEQSLLALTDKFQRMGYDATAIASAFFGVGNGEALRNGQASGLLIARTNLTIFNIVRKVERHLSQALTTAYRLGGIETDCQVTLTMPVLDNLIGGTNDPAAGNGQSEQP